MEVNTGQFLEKIMTKEVVTIHPDTIMNEVDQLFKTHQIHHLPVVDKEDNTVVGMLSKTDYDLVLHGLTLFKNREVENYNEHLLRSLLVKDVMTEEVICLSPKHTLADAAQKFRNNTFRALPIVDASNKLLGMVTTYDLLRVAYG